MYVSLSVLDSGFESAKKVVMYTRNSRDSQTVAFYLICERE